ncbi:MAG: hypothetical protein SGPRY_010531, partial [Prymnesium sp.]
AGKLFGRFRAKRAVEGASCLIEKGSEIPAVEVEMGPRGTPTSLASLLSSSSLSLLVGMPGAFTPICSSCHLPSLVACAPKLAELGVETIAVLTTNDRYVNEAWRLSVEKQMREEGTGGSVNLRMLSDADGAAVRALGLADDLGFGMGIRSSRFALLAKEGKVQHLAIDSGMDAMDTTSGDVNAHPSFAPSLATSPSSLRSSPSSMLIFPLLWSSIRCASFWTRSFLVELLVKYLARETLLDTLLAGSDPHSDLRRVACAGWVQLGVDFMNPKDDHAPPKRGPITS